MIQTRTTNTHPTAAEVEREWLALGVQPGGPAHVPPAVVAGDIRCDRVMKCPACQYRGMAVRAFHRLREFRLLCRCRSCGAGTEA
jgi:hypothetical protein